MTRNPFVVKCPTCGTEQDITDFILMLQKHIVVTGIVPKSMDELPFESRCPECDEQFTGLRDVAKDIVVKGVNDSLG